VCDAAATKWTTLTDFIKDLARRGVCTIEDTPKGWFMVYKPKDAEETLREALSAKRGREAEDAEARAERELAEGVARAAKAARLEEEAQAAGGAGGAPAGGAPGGGAPTPAELVRGEGDAPLRLAMAAPAARARLALAGGAASAAAAPSAAFAAPDEADDDDAARRSAAGGARHPPSALADIMAAEERARDAAARRAIDYWLFDGIVVKIMAKELAPQGYYKAKGVVRAVVDRYVAEVSLLEGGDVIRVDQAQLETVLPAVGGGVRVLKGAHRGAAGVLLSLDVARFKARVRLRRGAADGRELELDYEDVSKIAAA
jgi:DNA/RNA-binding protein KIN17